MHTLHCIKIAGHYASVRQAATVVCDISRGAAQQVYPSASSQNASGEETMLLGHRQWLVNHTFLPEWPGQLVKQVLHAPTSAEVWPTLCSHAVHLSICNATVPCVKVLRYVIALTIAMSTCTPDVTRVTPVYDNC